MEITFRFGFIIILSILSGVSGRLGGAKGYNTKWRDVGCSLITLFAFWFLFGFQLSLWWTYSLTFGLHWGAFSTYWDWLFKEDNLWVSGFCVGMALFPLFGWATFIRAIPLAIIWGCLNKYLPSAGISGDKRILFWRRDVVEEVLRYASVVLTLFILLMR